MSNPSSTGSYPPAVRYAQTPGVRYAQTPGVQNQDYLNTSGQGSHDTSRLSYISHDSHASAINLGGHDYNIGTRVGKSFIIGDPHINDPVSASQTFDDINVSKSAISTTPSGSSKLKPRDEYPVLEKNYNFEYWNWTIIRFLCLLMLIFVMLALLACVIGFIIVGKTKCTSPFYWWHGSFTYHISVPHFSDLDDEDNEFGDFKGLQDKIPYFTYLGIQTLVLSNFLSAQRADNRWDLVKSFSQVDDRLGTVADFVAMVEALQEQKIKVVLEFEPAYTSKLHLWYDDSRKHRPAYDSDYNTFYFWSEVPLSGQNGSWAQDESRLEYYQYLYDKDKPLLNWNTVEVQDAFLDDLRTWLRRGVDGFIMKGVHNIKTDSMESKRTITKGWRSLLDQYSNDEVDRKILSLDKSTIDGFQGSEAGREITDEVLGYVDVLEVPFSVKFDNLTGSLLGDVEEGLRWQREPGAPWTSWKLTNIGQVDVGYRTATMLYLLTLPGNPGLVAGQEIGRNILEERDPPPLLWRLESVFPYLTGSLLNETTIAILQSISSIRPTSYSLREDGVIEGEDEIGAELTKTMSHAFPYLDKESIILKRRYKRRDAFYFAGNFGKGTIERDWFDVIAGGTAIADSHKKISGSLSLAGDLTLERGQGIVLKVQY